MKLIEVSGVGAKVAIQILSSISVDELCTAIANEDSQRLTTIKGIGKKTAERIVLELKDKFDFAKKSSLDFVPSSSQMLDKTIFDDAVSALLALGISKNEATRLVNLAIKNGTTELSAIIQFALKNLY